MMNDAISEIIKGLSEEGEESLLHHAASSVAKALQGASEEEGVKHVGAFLMLLRKIDPDGFPDDRLDLPDASLEKDGSDDSSWQGHLKDLMHEQGHHYFGSLDPQFDEIAKHYYGKMGTGPALMDRRGYGPRGKKNPKKSKTHSYDEPQDVHGRGSGKRTLMGFLRAYAKQNPDADVPSWNEMKVMSHSDVIEIAEEFGVMAETRGPNLNVVDRDGKGEATRRSLDVSDVAPAAERGAGVNVTQETAPRQLKNLRANNAKLDNHRGKRKGLRDVVRRIGARKRKQLTDKEKQLPEGTRRYGDRDPNTTREQQPVMNATKEAIQRARLARQKQLARAVAPKAHDRDLRDEDDTPAPAKGKSPLPKLPDTSDAGERINRGVQEGKGPRTARESRAVGTKPGRPKNPNSLTRQKMEQLDADGKVEEYKRLVTQRKRLKDRIDSIKQNGGEVPKRLTGQYNKAQKQFIVANGALRRDEKVDRNKLRRLRESIEQGKSPSGEGPVKDTLRQPTEWRNPKETAKRILEESKGSENERGATYDGSRLKNLRDEHKTGFYVSLKGKGREIQGEPTAKDIEDFLTANKDELQNGALFGMWRDGRGSSTYHLDVSRHFDGKEEARRFGRDNDQLAVYDVQEGRDITPEMDPAFTDDVNPAEAASTAAVAREAERHVKVSDMEALDAAWGINHVGGEKPDSQATRLYNAEERHLRTENANPLGTIEKVQAYVNKKLATDWWKKTFPEVTEVEISAEAPGPGAAADATRARVRLRFNSEKFMTENVLLHELAHLVTSGVHEGHGPEYAANYVAMVRNFQGDERADALLADFAAGNVEVFDGPAGHFLPPKGERRNEMNRLLKIRTRLSVSLTEAQKRGDSALVSKLRLQRDNLAAQIKMMGLPDLDVDQIKAKGKKQQARLNGETT